MEKLTQLNALFTYEERCRCAAKQFNVQNPDVSLESRNFKNCKEYWAKLIADSWQVKIVDMLAEANNQQIK